MKQQHKWNGKITGIPVINQQKPKPTYCKVCGSLDIYNGEHDMCRAIDVARQQTALATLETTKQNILNLREHNIAVREKMHDNESREHYLGFIEACDMIIEKLEAEIKKLSATNSPKAG